MVSNSSFNFSRQLLTVVIFFNRLFVRQIVMLRVTEDLCDAMTKYNIRPKLPFRYKRGGKCNYLKRAIVTGAIVKNFVLF